MVITSNGHGEHSNAPVMIYDTSGPYTDPNTETDIRQGLQAAEIRTGFGARRCRRTGVPAAIGR